MLSNSEIDQLKKLKKIDLPPLELIKIDAPQFSKLQVFCDILHENAGIEVKKVAGDDQLPGIRVNRQLTYHAIPSGPELAPFTAALGEIPSPDDQLQSAAEKILGPVRIDVFIAPRCPFCPRAVETLLPLTTVSPFIKLAVIDAAFFGNTAQKANIQSTPTTLLDHTYRWIGLPPIAEIMAMAVDRDPSSLSPSALKGMISEGDADGLAQLMESSSKLFPGFIALLTDAKWSTRLGAMAAFEYLVELNPETAARYIQPLWDRLEHVDTQVQGDIAYLFGESKSRNAYKKLKLITQGDFSETVKEAAAEALEDLTQYDRE